jgi:tRNA U34 2-thiouridine synthase MnmA/TrmU
MKKPKAISMFSGGLDSILATKLILNQNIDVIALHFSNPFCFCVEGLKGIEEVTKRLRVPLKKMDVGVEYLKMLRKPNYGYGKNLNPCIDCRIYILRKAKQIAKDLNADFIFTGEVLNERPMSQNKQAMRIIEKETGLRKKILRPLSAKLFPQTDMEKKGIVDRSKLLAINGRSRKPQIELAKKFGIEYYPSPAGGCLLTCKEYAKKLQDLFDHKKKISMKDVKLLKVGRHFRLNKNKIIVGRSEEENNQLIVLKAKSDYYFEVPDIGSPTTILKGSKTKTAIKTAAKLTAFYSDTNSTEIDVNFGRQKMDKTITINVPTANEVDKLRI